MEDSLPVKSWARLLRMSNAEKVLEAIQSYVARKEGIEHGRKQWMESGRGQRGSD